MDLRARYRRIEEVANSLPGDPVVVVSLDTVDGGRAGIKTHVSRRLAAQLVVDAKARLASEAEAEEFAQEQELLRQRHEQSMNKQPQILVLSENDLKAMRAGKPKVA